MSRERLSLVGAGLTSVQQLPDLAKHAAEVRVLCLHGNRIAELYGIEQLRCLTDVNLSSNELHSLQGLQMLTALTSINLASNRLASLDGLRSLTTVQRLILSHNFIRSLAGFVPGVGCVSRLRSLDLHNNLLASVQELSALRGHDNLQDLTLSGGHPGNACCSIAGFRQCVVQMLPQLDLLDGQKLQAVRFQPWTDTQQQIQPQQHSLQPGALFVQPHMVMPQPQPLALPAPVAAVADPNTVMTAVQQHTTTSLPVAAGISGTQTDMIRAPMLEAGCSGSQEGRIAALESRLREVLNVRRRPPLAPTENLLHQGAPLASQQARKIRPKAVTHEVACQTATSMGQLESLQHDAAQLKQELQTLATQLDQRTSHALRVQEQAELLVHEVEQQADHKVMGIRQQANDALQQASTEIAEAEQAAAHAHQQTQEAQGQHKAVSNQLAELQWELRHAWDQSKQADQAQKEALQAAETQIVKLESDHLQSVEVAARVKETADRAQADAARLAENLVETKAALQTAHQVQAQLEKELQQCNNAASSHSASAVQAAAANQTELESLRRQLSVNQQETQTLRGREEEARTQAKQLASALTMAQIDYQKGLECKVQWYETQIRREVEGKDVEASKHAQQQQQLQASRDALQKQLAVTEAEFRLALQEHDRAAVGHQQQLQQQATETVDLRRALQTAHQQHEEQEALLKELTEVLQRQKTRVAALQKDRAGMVAQLAAYQPAEQDKLRAEMGTLRERVGELAGIKDRLMQEQLRCEQLQSQLTSAQSSHQQAAAAAASQLAAAQDALGQLEQEASEKLGQADLAAVEAEGQLDELAHDLEEARAATKVKEAMVDDAQASIASLKSQLNAAQAEADDSAQALRHAEADLNEHEAEEQRQHQSLRLEIEAQEQALEQLEKSTQEATRRAHDAEQKAKSALDTLKEKDQMLKYVEEEVDRVKGLFEQKETRLTSERDSAKQAAQQLAGEHEALTQKLHKLEQELQHLPGALEAEKAKCQAAEQACSKAQSESIRSAMHLEQVEDEMRELLSVMEQQKAASAAKVKQLANILQDMQAPATQ